MIHTVGPVWRGGQHHEDERLASCYQSSLTLAVEYKIRTLAFPAISTGVYGFPLERATRIAIATVNAFLDQSSVIEQVRFVCFGDEAYEGYQSVLADTFGNSR